MILNRRHFVEAALGSCVSAPALSHFAGQASGDPVGELSSLFARADDANLAQHPILAMERGDQRFADRVGEDLSPHYFATERARCDASLAALARIDRTRLSQHGRLMADVFEHSERSARQLAASETELVCAVSRVSHFDSLISFMPDLASGSSVARFETAEDYKAGLNRLRDFGQYLNLCRATLARGVTSGITQPKVIVEQTSLLLRLMIETPIEDSPFLKPVRSFPPGVPKQLHDSLNRAYRAELTEKLLPAYRALKHYLDVEYLQRARMSIALSDVPGGAALYSALTRNMTTTNLSPAEIHQTGLTLVEVYRFQMDEVRRAVNFDGNLSSFFDHVRTAPEFKYKSRDEMLAAYQSVSAKVNLALPQLFRLMPQTPFEIRLTPPYLEQTQAAGYYQPGSADGKRPGVFFANAYDLPSRTINDRETLFLHEAIPGHHFQVSLTQENQNLPAFQKFNFNNAYVEGWALYCETLGPELGLFTDPYQRLGFLDAMMLRAMRLVVDTGMHSFGWSRERSIDFLKANSSISDTDARVEVDRYIAIPAQALGYMVGNLVIRQAREKAATLRGASFDLRDFHEIVLRSGPLPLDILEREVIEWATASDGTT
jgi:uncharacterized protein (DUF885 family)